LQPAQPEDRYADIYVDFARARQVYRKWLALARPASGDLRRPIWLFRPVKPALDAYRLPDDPAARAAREALAAAPSPFEFHTLVDWSPEQVWGSVGDGWPSVTGDNHPDDARARHRPNATPPVRSDV